MVKTLRAAGLVLVAVGFLAMTAVGEEISVDLPSAIDQELVACRVVSQGELDHVVLLVKNMQEEPIQVIILPGTVFVPSDEAVQQMGAVDQVTIYLAPGEEKEVVVPTACFQMTLDQPGEDIEFVYVRQLPHDEIRRLCSSPTFQTASFRVKQFAIWTLIENPNAVDDYAELGFGEEFVANLEELGFPLELLVLLWAYPEVLFELSEEEIEGLELIFTLAGIPVQSFDDLYQLLSTGGPTSGELAQVREIFIEAGIPTGDFYALACAEE